MLCFVLFCFLFLLFFVFVFDGFVFCLFFKNFNYFWLWKCQSFLCLLYPPQVATCFYVHQSLLKYQMLTKHSWLQKLPMTCFSYHYAYSNTCKLSVLHQYCTVMQNIFHENKQIQVSWGNARVSVEFIKYYLINENWQTNIYFCKSDFKVDFESKQSGLLLLSIANFA